MQRSLLAQLRAAARAELTKAPDAPTTTVPTGWALSGNVGDLLTWVLGGRTVLDPAKIYADARRAFDALETLLAQNTDGGSGGAATVWFFDAPRPTLFDAHVFSYTHLILNDDYILPDAARRQRGARGTAKQDEPNRSAAEFWGDETLRKIVRDCPRLVEHAETMLRTYWPEGCEDGLEGCQ